MIPDHSPALFILGSPRSGTSVLHWALLQHPELWGSEESEFLLPIARCIHAAFERGMRYAPHSWLQAQKVSPDEFAAYVGSGLDALYASRAGDKRWIEQTPSYSAVALELAAMFPRARFLHIVRDGRQVADSMRRMWDWDIARCAREWRNHVTTVLELERRHPDRVLRVSYEQLVHSPESVFADVFLFLDLPECSESAGFVAAKPINAAPGTETQSRREKLTPRWQHWPREDLRAFYSEAAELLLALGYPCEPEDIELDALQWLGRGEHIEIDDRRVFWRHTINEQARWSASLVLIHGFPTASWDWHRIWPFLAQWFRRLVAMDMPGFGFSDKPADMRYSIARQADLHERLSERLGIERCHLLVHDYGVSVAQELLARQNRGNLPFAIDSCVFLNGGLFHGVHRPLPIQKLLASPLGRLLAPLLSRDLLARSMRRIYHRPPPDWEIDQMWQLIRHADGHKRIHKLIRYLHERKRFRKRWLEALQQAGIPMALIVGSNDPVSGANIAAAWRELVGKDNVQELHQSGHYPQLENPSGLLAACETFWSNLKS